MCYHLAIFQKQKALEKRYEAEFKDPESYRLFYHANAFSAPDLPVITSEEPHKINLYKWGLIPFWVKNIDNAGKIRVKTANARAETVFEKPSFKHSIRNKRCLIPVNGFFEWQEAKGKRYPYFIKMREAEVFSLAGIYASWKDPKAKVEYQTFSIITKEANQLLEKIHNTKKRMPVIIDKKNEKIWLKRDLVISEINNLMASNEIGEIEAYTVSKLISAKNTESNIPQVLERYDYPER